MTSPLRGWALREALASMPFDDRDAYVDQLLGLEEPPPDAGLPQGGVPYLPAGVEEIVSMVRETRLSPTDELVDLGSGLGRVVMLAHLLSGARTTGIEIQRHLVERARERARALGLDGAVRFVEADAAEAELDGSVFFLYAPFNGPLLTRVLARIEPVAKRRKIVVCTVDLDLKRVGWLRERAGESLALTLYDPVSAP